MDKNIKSIRGMKDYFSYKIQLLQIIEKKLKKILNNYGITEIRTPIVEQVSLFSRAIGQVTDVVKKEMYIFQDKDGNKLALRPENTASCVRSGIEHGLLYKQQQRFWYLGPMFRYERPQKGRYRQFYQLGVEIFGVYGPEIDAEIISIAYRFWNELKISKHITLELNSIGSIDERSKYQTTLINFFKKNENKLDKDSFEKILKNPLKTFDSKDPYIQLLLHKAPILYNFLHDESKKYFTKLCKLLKKLGIKYRINQRLVRGLDYYNQTVFEWTTNDLGTKKSICAGGRYDFLVEQLGGHKTPAIGFAIGLERVMLLTYKVNPWLTDFKNTIDIYLISLSNTKQESILILSEMIRNQIPDIKIVTHYGKCNLKRRLIYANKLKIKLVLILDEENIPNEIIIKDLRKKNQKQLPMKNIIAYLKTILTKNIS